MKLAAKPIQRSAAPALKPIKKTMRPLRPLLNYVQEAKNPLEGLKPGKTEPETLKRQIDAVGLAFRAAAKSSQAKMLHEKEGYGAEYFVVVMQDADQATALLEALGYPEPKDVYIDGLLLADLLKVDLPKSSVGFKKLKAIHNPKLTRLAQPLKPR